MESKKIASASKLSRRALLRGLGATAISTGAISRGVNVFAKDGTVITPFTYHASQAALDDLKRRLAATRWPERETVADWAQGVPLAKLRALVEYWQTGYDWRRFEAKLNGFAQYRTEIDGLNIHFLHVRLRHANPLPIIITHGWPGSVIEFFRVIDPLTNPTAHDFLVVELKSATQQRTRREKWTRARRERQRRRRMSQ